MLKTALKRKLLNKKGSSLPMVLAIGLVLVIWVMALSPIVATQGTISADVRNQEEDYLNARSAIEFTKGELINMVAAKGKPQTFAVTYEAAAGEEPSYKAVIKEGSTTYSNYIAVSPTDTLDVPRTDEAGKVSGDKVAAICAVEKPGAGSRDYKIYVTTYSHGEECLTYTTTYTPPVISKMINPEAYKKTQALPLSDFVLVDGKLGNNLVWNSTLTTLNNNSGSKYTHLNYINVVTSGTYKGKFQSYKDDYREELRPLSGGNYLGDAGAYPAVFKRSASVPTEASEDVAENFASGGTATTPTLSVTSATVNGTQLTVTLSDHGAGAVYCCVGENGQVLSNWNTGNTVTVPAEAGKSYYFYCYIMEHVENGAIMARSDVSNAAPVSVYMFNPNNKASSISTGKKYIMYTTSGTQSFSLGSNSSGNNLNTSPISAGLQVYSAGALWEVNGSGNRYSFKINGKYLNYSNGLFSDAKYGLGNSNQSLTYKNNSISIEYWGDDYYVEITDTSTFCSESQKDVFFFEVTPPSSTAPAAPECLDMSFSVSRPAFEETAKISIIKDLYKTACSNKGVSNPTIYITAVSRMNYDVYVSGTYQGRPLFAKIDNIVLRSTGFGVAGHSLYFMDSSNAFNTNGKPVYVKTDLLVIRGDIATGGGAVYVEPYLADDTLAFFVKGTGYFKGYNFYQIPRDTNLLEVTEAQVNSWLVCDRGDPDFANGSVIISSGGKVTSIEFPKQVIHLENSGYYKYPVINFDIAYATDEQLAHVVSGEAARWTSNGVLQDNSTQNVEPNTWYVVCPFITSISGSANLSANRILFDSLSDKLEVSGNINLLARYISVGTSELIQNANGATLKLYCQTAKGSSWEGLFAAISSALGSIDYSSDTMQVDYEQATTIKPKTGASSLIPSQICRYPTGTDMFTIVKAEGSETDNKQKNLRAEYTVEEIKRQFDTEALEAKYIERYMYITGDAGTNTLNLYRNRGLLGKWTRVLKLYSNYIFFDDSIDYIDMRDAESLVWGQDHGDLLISSQESGYTGNEYLYLFNTNSSEIYTGTLVFFEGDVIVRYGEDGRNEHKIDQGFYSIPAKTAGTSILQINTSTIPKLTEEDFKKYSTYINADGSMNSAYVDTGFETDAAEDGGFGGGSVE